MGAWDLYEDRMSAKGTTRRGAQLKREKYALTTKVPDSLTYQTVTIYDPEHSYNIDTEEMAAYAVQRTVSIINSDNLNEKTITSLPDEDIENGSLIYWMDQYWLVAERDANTTVYTRGKLIQLNHLLKWVSNENVICEQWCLVEDGTKLKRISVRNSLACRKQYAKSIPLIAGNSLEPYSLQHKFETKLCAIA